MTSEGEITLETGFEIKRELRICRVPYAPNPVFRGLWHFYSTMGYPLGEAMSIALASGIYPDWAYLILEIAGEGWNDTRIYNFIASEMEGVYSPQVAETIRKGIAKLMEKKAKA